MKTSWSVFVLRLLRYGFVALLGLTVVGFILQTAAYLGLDGGKAFLRSEVALAPAQAGAVGISGSDAAVRVFDFGKRGVVLREFGRSAELLDWPVLLYFVFYTALWLLAAGALYYLARLFGRLARGEFFHRENARLLQRLAIGALAFPLLYLGAGKVLRLVFHGLTVYPVRTGMHLESVLLFGLFSLLLLAGAEVMRRGAELQHEQDLTV